MSSTVNALVLDDSVSRATAEPVHFANFPGLWLEGQPIAVSELGFDEGVDVYALVGELGLPLRSATVAPGEGLMPAVANHVPAGEVAVAFDDGEVETVPEAEASDPFAEAVALRADELIPAIENASDLAWLDTLEAEEKASKNRTSVLTAIDERRAALTPPPEPEVTV